MPTPALAETLSDMANAYEAWRRYRHLTMQPRARYMANIVLARQVFRSLGEVNTSVVECGTWRGGMALGLMRSLPSPEFHFFDSFQGLPATTTEDGEEAGRLFAEGALWFNNNLADEGEFRRHLAALVPSPERATVHPGWFADTVPRAAIDCPVGVLRIDGDWYESTLLALTYLFPRVRVGGLVLIDDYLDWPGCARAVHRYLADHDRPERIRSVAAGAFAYLVKEG